MYLALGPGQNSLGLGTRHLQASSRLRQQKGETRHANAREQLLEQLYEAEIEPSELLEVLEETVDVDIEIPSDWQKSRNHEILSSE